MNRAKYLAVIATLVLGITGSAFADGNLASEQLPPTLTACCSNAKTCCLSASVQKSLRHNSAKTDSEESPTQQIVG